MPTLTKSERVARGVKQLAVKLEVARNNVNRANKKWVRTGKQDDLEHFCKMVARYQMIFWSLDDLKTLQQHGQFGGKKWH